MLIKGDSRKGLFVCGAKTGRFPTGGPFVTKYRHDMASLENLVNHSIVMN